MLLPVDQDDEKSVFLEIQAGAGEAKQLFLLVIFYECIHDSQERELEPGDNFRKNCRTRWF